ncbi:MULTISPECIES: DUF2497 domain-containing protein [unclassified Chelatococcus]|uniref:PopZ family protein n=1 Tax=unclassified Chelatococcus TaxID=2638111 RepID=UPI001BCD728E|nr:MULTISPECIES: DUF2497 domain-containing protein [unclassified Chelatococcus]MBS7699524.1 DUF2497 domain-containing protein [Chelatococcus sp. YT9]MBX3559557.1 DUF2497 domain-containing protein [Chelatococcus sp.]
MDEILASIRRIIADDQAQGFAGPARRNPPPEAYAAERGEPRSDQRLETRTEPRRPSRPLLEGAPDMRLGEADRLARAPKTLNETADMRSPPPPVMREPAPHTFSPPPAEAVLRAQAVPAEALDSGPRLRRSEGADIAERLLSPQSHASVSTAFDALASSAAQHVSPTMEDFVREMLRPMLKSWLDENLPSLVERLVRQEIERVARGQGQR